MTMKSILKLNNSMNKHKHHKMSTLLPQFLNKAPSIFLLPIQSTCIYCLLSRAPFTCSHYSRIHTACGDASGNPVAHFSSAARKLRSICGYGDPCCAGMAGVSG